MTRNLPWIAAAPVLIVLALVLWHHRRLRRRLAELESEGGGAKRV